MEKKGVIDVVVRPKRQITLPREVCEQLGIGIGDKLEMVADGDQLVARPKKVLALESLREIRETFKSSGITEDELQEAGRRVRHELTKGRHAEKA